MKKIATMMFPKYEKTKYKIVNCCVCGKPLTPSEAYYCVDGNNYAITNNSKPYCKDCKNG